MSDTYDIRCPVCLTGKTVSKKISFFKILLCEGCGGKFEFRNSLPGIKKQPEVSEPVQPATSVSDNHPDQNLLFWGIISIFFSCGVSVWVGIVGRSMGRYDFLVTLLSLFFITIIGSFLIRFFWWDQTFIRLAGFLAFEGSGVPRLLWGTAEQLGNRNYLIIFLIIGGLLYFARAEHFKVEEGGGFGSGCGGCSGCGGGCGGCGD